MSSAISLNLDQTAAVAWRLERPPSKREVVGSILGRDRPKSIKLFKTGNSGFPQFRVQDIKGRALRLAR